MKPDKLTISIALCSYNGESYIKEQLESIANQSLLPYEMVICDDNSKDKTIKIIKSFANKVFFKVRLFENKFNLGTTKNFEKAIGLCGGDIIVLSDQTN